MDKVPYLTAAFRPTETETETETETRTSGFSFLFDMTRSTGFLERPVEKTSEVRYGVCTEYEYVYKWSAISPHLSLVCMDLN